MPEPSSQRWFEVTATIKVKAADESDAINRVAGAIRHGYKKAPGVYPVGNFDARETTDPLTRTARTIT